jgi:hypothetical protein
MARRYDQVYRVKARDNLGDPEYWNRRFEDIDRRVSSNEEGLDAIGGLTSYVEGLALNRLDLVLAPALDKIALVSQQGFLMAHSISSIVLDINTTQTFAIPDLAERELFAPSPFVTLVRQANTTDYAFAKLISWNRDAGQLVLQPLEIFGNPGPFNDWVVYVGTAISQAVAKKYADVIAARDATLGYRDTAAASATQTASDRTAVASMKTDVLTIKAQVQTYADNAQIFDPSFYIKKDVGGTYTQVVSFTMSPIVPTAAAGDNSGAAASTAFVKNAIDTVIAGAPGTMDTLNEIASKITSDEGVVGGLISTVAGKVQKDQNLGDLPDKAAARTNLGLVGAAPTGKAGAAAAAGTAVTYMRSDANIAIDLTFSPSWTGNHQFSHSSGQSSLLNVGSAGGLTIYAPDQGAAFISYHRGAYAIQSGLDGDNWWRIGGWSQGASARFGISPSGDGYFPSSLGIGTTGQGGGSIVATGDIVYGISDARLKDDIEVISDALNKLRQLRGVTWIQSDLAKAVGAPEQKRRKAGLLAQDLKPVLPEAVGRAPFDIGEDGESKSGMDFMNIYFDQVLGLIVEAIKALADKVDALEGS